jgi:hypothetical protein
MQAWRLIKIGTMIIVPILLLVLPKDYFDHGGPQLSLFGQLGMENYYSKGLTRASMHLLHLDFAGAAAYNKLSFVVVPLLIVVYVGTFLQQVRRYRQARPSPSPSA